MCVSGARIFVPTQAKERLEWATCHLPNLSGVPRSSDEVNDEEDDEEREQDVNCRYCNVKSDESDQPSDQEEYRDC